LVEEYLRRDLPIHTVLPESYPTPDFRSLGRDHQGDTGLPESRLPHRTSKDQNRVLHQGHHDMVKSKIATTRLLKIVHKVWTHSRDVPSNAFMNSDEFNCFL